MEDVSFMKEFGEPETQIVFVDSANRDPLAYPDPANYTIVFDEPIKNVIGVDVLDAVIPSTMYVVDTHNQDLLMYVLGITSSPLHQRSIADASYYLKWMLSLDRPTQDMMAPDSQLNSGVSITLQGLVSVLDERYGDVVPTDLIDVAGSPENDRYIGVRVLDSYKAGAGVAPDGYTVITYKTQTYWLPNTLGFLSERYLIDEVNGQVLMVIIAKMPALPTGFPVVCQRLRFPVGNYQTMTDIISVASDGGGDPVAATTTGTPVGDAYLQSQSTNTSRLLKLLITSVAWSNYLVSEYALLALDTTCGMASVLGFGPNSVAPSFNILAGNSAPRQFLTNQVGGSAPTATMNAPGIVNMTGERYIILRCPEIEAGLYSPGFSSGPIGTGLGIFRLQQPGVFADQRNDYVSVVTRPFHPIGRLDQLTLNLERGSSTTGELYDFKGVDYLMIISIKSYATKRLGHPATGSVLNPNYSPDFMAYQIKHRMRQNDMLEGPLSQATLRSALTKHETLTNRDDRWSRPLASADADDDSSDDDLVYPSNSTYARDLAFRGGGRP